MIKFSKKVLNMIKNLFKNKSTQLTNNSNSNSDLRIKPTTFTRKAKSMGISLPIKEMDSCKKK